MPVGIKPWRSHHRSSKGGHVVSRTPYIPRYVGPVINVFNDSTRIDLAVSGVQSDRMALAWDQLCDENPALPAWNEEALPARRGTVLWKCVDTDRAPTFTRTRSRNLIVTLDAGTFLAVEWGLPVKRLLLETVAARAEMDGITPPPVGPPWGEV